jgi:eukaryotic-like serine/threonine-protein kinase
LRGGTLKECLDDASYKVTEDWVMEIFMQILNGVWDCMEAGVLHRDLKPQNVVFVDELLMDIKIVDFDTCIEVKDETTQLSTAVGTLEYMAPEVLESFIEIQVCRDPLKSCSKSDIFSLGLILFEMLHRRPPYVIPVR